MKKTLKRTLSVMLAAALVTSIAPAAGNEAMAQEAQEGGSWRVIDERWHYQNPDGTMATGWNQINGAWYYFNEYDGAMSYNEITSDGYYVGADGAQVTKSGWVNAGHSWLYIEENTKAATQWKLINGVWYYFGNNGYMYDGETTEDGYYLDASGAMATTEGWYHGDSWVYVESGNKVKTGWQYIGGSWYCFDDSGYMMENSCTPDGYYVGADGAQVTNEGWQSDGVGWSYVMEGGSVVYGEKTIAGKEYYFNEYGSMLSFAVSPDGYYFGESGARQTEEGWYDELDAYYYYVKEDGTAAIGWQTIDDDEYYFSESPYSYGLMSRRAEIDGKLIGQDGRVLIDDNWKLDAGSLYYLDEQGEPVTGWQIINDEYLYFEGSGELSYGCATADKYLLGMDGYIVDEKGWYTAAGNITYYISEEGTVLTGWNQMNGNWYYFDEVSPDSRIGRLYQDEVTPDKYLVNADGAMVTNEGWYQTESGSWYYALANGQVLGGWQYIGGSWYYFSDNSTGYGIMADGTVRDGYILGRDGKMVE